MTRESRETSAEPGPGHAPSLSSCMAHSVLSLSASVPSCEQGQGPSLEGLLGPSTYWWEPEPLLLFSPSLFFFFFAKNMWFIKESLSSAAFIQRTKQMKK